MSYSDWYRQAWAERADGPLDAWKIWWPGTGTADGFAPKAREHLFKTVRAALPLVATPQGKARLIAVLLEET